MVVAGVHPILQFFYLGKYKAHICIQIHAGVVGDENWEWIFKPFLRITSRLSQVHWAV